MKIVIVGGGKVGSSLCEELNSQDNDIILIEKDPVILERLINKYDINGIVGNGASINIQQEIGIEDVDIFIAVTEKDEINVIAAILAKKMGAIFTVARVRDPEYSEQFAFVRDSLGISMLINPELSAARDIARVLKYPSALSVESFAGGRVNLVEIEVDEHSVLRNLQINRFRQLFGNVIVCVVQRGGQAFVPDGDTVIELGDRIHVTGSAQDMTAFFKRASDGEKAIGSVMIVGGGRISHYLLRALLPTKLSTTLIEISDSVAAELAQEFPRTEVIVADGTNQEVLEEYQIGNYDAFISLTGVDEENLIMSVYAKHNGVKKVITKMSRPGILKIIKNVSIKSIITPKKLVTDDIIQFVRSRQNAEGSNIEALYRIAEDQVEAMQFRIKAGSKVCGIPLMDLKTKPGLLIGYIVRGETLIFPDGNDSLQKHDRVIVVTTNKYFQDIDDILEDE